jgi:hypothetical protein
MNADEIKKRLEGLNDSLIFRSGSILREYGIHDDFDISKPIYHYTTATGLKGILESKVIWATNSDYLNDVSELRYGRGLIANLLNKRVGAFPLAPSEERTNPEDYCRNNPEYDCDRALKFALQTIIQHYQLDDPVSYYISSFCKADNLLSQWRAYGGRGGYSIGFSVGDTTFSYGDPERRYFTLHNILYNASHQEKLFSDLVEVAKEIVARRRPEHGYEFDLTEDKAWMTIEDDLRHILRVLGLRLKHSSFQEESECRFLTLRAPDQLSDLKYRESSGLLIPYVEIPLSLLKIKITSVRCGPTLARGKAKRSVEMLLRQHVYEDVEVYESEIPLGW